MEFFVFLNLLQWPILLKVANDGLRENQKLGQHRGPCHKLAILDDKPHVLLSAGEDGIVFSHDIRKPKSNK